MTNLKIGVVGIPGAWSTEVLADNVEARTGFRFVIDFADVKINLATGQAMYKEQDLCSFDALIVKKVSKQYSPVSVDRLIALEWINNQGVSVYSNPASMGRLINRLGCTMALSNAGVPMPRTAITESVDHAMSVIEDYESCVLKPLFSTKAMGMCVLNHSDPELCDKLTDFQKDNPVMYLQQKLDLPGRDLGVMFLGDEYIGTYARVSQGEGWNTTTRDGGKYACHEPHEKTIEMARKARDCFDLTYTTVDVVEFENLDNNVIFEVSAFGGFRGAKEGCDIDIAKLYVNYVIQQLEGKK